MKKINNRGFAISTMLYGLLIIMVLMMALLMSTLAFTRNNNKKFVNEIVDNLEKKSLKIQLSKVVYTNDESSNKVTDLCVGDIASLTIIFKVTGIDSTFKKRDKNGSYDFVGNFIIKDGEGTIKKFSYIEIGDIHEFESSNRSVSYKINLYFQDFNDYSGKLILKLNEGLFKTNNEQNKDTELELINIKPSQPITYNLKEKKESEDDIDIKIELVRNTIVPKETAQAIADSMKFNVIIPTAMPTCMLVGESDYKHVKVKKVETDQATGIPYITINVSTLGQNFTSFVNYFKNNYHLPTTAKSNYIGFGSWSGINQEFNLCVDFCPYSNCKGLYSNSSFLYTDNYDNCKSIPNTTDNRYYCNY